MARKGREISGRDGECESEEWLENVRETDDGGLNIVAVDEQTFARNRIVSDRHPANAGLLFAHVWRVAETARAGRATTTASTDPTSPYDQGRYVCEEAGIGEYTTILL